MKIQKWKIPVANPERKGVNRPYQYEEVRGYLIGLEDSGIARKAIELSHGKGDQVLDIIIELIDDSRESIIEKTLREKYMAMSPEEYKEFDLEAHVDSYTKNLKKKKKSFFS